MLIDDTLANISIVFTGKLPSGLTRKQASKIVYSHAGIVEDRISEITDYVVVGEVGDDTAKIRKAKQLTRARIGSKNPLKIINEVQLWSMAETGKKI